MIYIKTDVVIENVYIINSMRRNLFAAISTTFLGEIKINFYFIDITLEFIKNVFYCSNNAEIKFKKILSQKDFIVKIFE